MSSVRLISSGGASVTPAFVEEAARTFDCRVKRTYGSTEAPTVTTSRNDDSFEKARDTDGRAVGEVELRVSDPETGRAPGAGDPGELWVRGPEMFAGYADAAQTATVIAPGGWFRTGDLATVDGEGWVRIVGRLKDVIIRGGENISASEVEAALEAHPRCVTPSAVGYPDPLMGERVAAFVESSEPFDLEECRRWFSSRGMAVFKTPEKVERLDQLPLLGSGKADRAALRRRAGRRLRQGGTVQCRVARSRPSSSVVPVPRRNLIPFTLLARAGGPGAGVRRDRPDLVAEPGVAGRAERDERRPSATPPGRTPSR